ncbi:MAG: hypothetical protein ABIR16_01500 [Dokdonella sp.]
MSTRNDRDLDDLLGEDSGRVGALYRKLSRSDPPRRLDRNVIAEASRAVHGRPRGPRWLLGVGAAAGVLLAAGIAWRVNHDMNQQREAAPMSVPASPAANVDAPAPNVIRVEPRESAEPTPMQQDEAKFSERADAKPERNSATVAKPHQEAAAPRVTPGAAPILRKAEQAKQKLDRGFVADPAETQSASATEDDNAKLRERRRDAPAATPQTAAPMRDNEAESSAAAQLRADEPSASAADSASMTEPVGAGRAAAKTMTTLDAVAAEIERIRQLLGNGRRDEARAALHRLREQNPDLVLPDDLRDLAR